jgi:hypothetical protein
MYRHYNPNPTGARVGDCTVRAISKATGEDWARTFCGLCAEGMRLCDMPSANHVWGAYLRRRGFRRHALSDACPDCYTVADFCREHPSGVYVLAISGHVVCVQDGDYYDSWDSGAEAPAYYWQKEE